ncbi:MAG: YdcF family protein [Bacillota bacterium]
MDSAYLIHGCHLQADNWEHIVWGSPEKDEWGRASHALRLAARNRKALLIWGTGASSQDGALECDYTFRYAVAHATQLPDYEGFDAYEVEALLKHRSHFDREAQNTQEEITNALRVCRERGIGTLYLVSSPTHISRCLLDAEKVRRMSNDPHGVMIYATASDTCFEDSVPDDVIIVEPPHRGDMPLWQTFRYVRAMFSIMRQGETVFQGFLQKFGELLESYGVPVDWSPVRQRLH